MNEQRQQAYFNLIQSLLNCRSHDQVREILAANQELVDVSFLQTVEAVADMFSQQGYENTANWLRNLAMQLGEALNPDTKVDLQSLSEEEIQAYFQFLTEVRQAIADSEGNPQVVYPLLAKNTDKLDGVLAEILRWEIDTLREAEADVAQFIAGDIRNFSNLIAQFPLGNKARNMEIAITGYEGVLTVYTQQAFPEKWAGTQNNLAAAYINRIRGERAQNLEQAIACLQEALKVYTIDAFPQNWAGTQNNLANAYGNRIRGERAQNLEQVIAACQDALKVYTIDAFPEDWASTQNNLANAYTQRIRGERAENLEQAIAFYQQSLKVYTFDAFPYEWAGTQNNLGEAYSYRIRGERAENLEQAIAFYQQSLKVYTIDAFPYEWARTQNNLATAYSYRIIGERPQNLEQAIAIYQQSLKVYTIDSFPYEWATTQNNLGEAYRDRITGERSQNLEQAIAYYQQSLKVYKIDAFPYEWAATQNNLATAYSYRITGERAQNLEQAIAFYQQSLKVYTIDAFPYEWARTQNNLGEAYRNRIRGERAQNLEQAIAFYQQSLKVYTIDAFPYEWARTQNNLATAYSYRIIGERPQNLEQAIAIYQQSLKVYTIDSFPYEWATTQNNLGEAYRDRITGERSQNLEQAIACFQNALKIYNRKAFPHDYAKTQFYLGVAYQDLLNFEEAYKALSEAVQKVDYLKGKTTPNSDSQHEESEIWIILYQRLVEISLNLGSKYYCKAIEYIEASKSIHLRDLLAFKNVYSNPNFLPKGDIPPKFVARLNSLRQEISRENKNNSSSSLSVIYSETINSYIANTRNTSRSAFTITTINTSTSAFTVATAINTSTPSSTIATTINTSTSASTRVNELIKDLETLIKEKIEPIDTNFNVNQQVCYSKIQELIKNSKIVIIEWYFTRKTFVTCIFSENTSTPEILQSSEEDFQKLIDWSKTYFTNYQNNKQEWRESLNSQLDELGKIIDINKIVKTIKEKFANNKQLLLIPHKILHSLPIHALRLSDNSYLLDQFENGVRYVPSCGILDQIQNRSFFDFSNLYAIQNPTYDLDFTNIEVQSISRYFKFPESQIFKEDDAIKKVLNNVTIRDSHCMHLACHAKFNFQDPYQSALILADAIVPPEKIDTGSNNYEQIGNWTIDREKCLSLEDILKLELNNCRLVVLSACETAMTDGNSVIDEYLCLPGAFLVAGSIGVVGSLWRVDDYATALLMVKFYEYLEQVNTVTVALKKAQTWLRDATVPELKELADKLSITPTEKEFLFDWLYKIQSEEKMLKSPYYWAAFCIVGN